MGVFETYKIVQPTLEQVFLRFAAKQRKDQQVLVEDQQETNSESNPTGDFEGEEAELPAKLLEQALFQEKKKGKITTLTRVLN